MDPDFQDLHARIVRLEQGMDDFRGMREDVQEIKMMLQQGKGAIVAIKLLFFIVGPVVAAAYWIKDHVR